MVAYAEIRDLPARGNQSTTCAEYESTPACRDSRGQTMRRNQTLCFGEVHRFLDGLFDGDLHAKRILSLTNATLGVIKTASLAVNTIGQGLALARGLVTKHAIKQVDRLLSNEGIDIDAALRHWVPYVVGSRACINVAMDWTDHIPRRSWIGCPEPANRESLRMQP
jgi:hypothetical protein